MARTGKGKRTAQYNPTKEGGAANLAAYVLAIAQHESRYVPGRGRVGAHDEGGRIIHATPKSKRQEYASAIWANRKARGNPLKKWTRATLNGVPVRIRSTGRALQIDLGKVA